MTGSADYTEIALGDIRCVNSRFLALQTCIVSVEIGIRALHVKMTCNK